METLKSKKNRIWMLVVILLMQIILPTLSITLESALTLISSASTEWDISATESDSVKAVFDDTTGTLTISGTGAMQDWENKGDCPWYSRSSEIKNVTIAEGITNIGDRAFYQCENLTEVIIPESVTRVGSYAFYWCDSLLEITIPEGVTMLGESTFESCGNLIKIEIPASLQSMSMDAFYGCNDLVEINVAEGNEIYSSENGILYNKEKTEIIRYPSGKTETTFEIPSSVKGIGDYSFTLCVYLKEIIIPNDVMSIGDYAFYKCINLVEITIPEKVTTIGKNAFASTSLTEIIIPEGVETINYATFNLCSDLREITIPNTVTSIEPHAFEACYALTEITIPNSVTSIGDYAFFDCDSLANITISEGLTSIGSAVFYSCKSLTKIEIPESVSSIDSDTFEYCESLTEINVAEENKQYSSENGILYNKAKTELICYPAGKEETKFEVPEGVTSIGDSAFIDCNNLKEIVIPNDVTSIDTFSFFICRNLTIYCQANSYAEEYAIENEIPYVLIVGDKLSLEAKLTTTISKMIEDMNTEGEIKVYKGETEVTDTNEKLATGMTLKITLGEDTEEYVITVTGDVNGDGEADIRDILAINKHRLNKTALEGAYLLAGYVTEDENVDIMDILQINKYRLGKIENL